MVKNESEHDVSEGFSDYIRYYEDDNSERTAFVTILKVDGGLISFRTKAGNIITIPSQRLIKMKQKEAV